MMIGRIAFAAGLSLLGLGVTSGLADPGSPNQSWIINDVSQSGNPAAVVCSPPSNLEDDDGAFSCIQVICADAKLYIEFTTSDIDLPSRFTLRVNGIPFAITASEPPSEGYKIRAPASPDLLDTIATSNHLWLEGTDLVPPFASFTTNGAAVRLQTIRKLCAPGR